jgi:hypothetical protein
LWQLLFSKEVEMTVLEIILIVGMVASIAATIAQIMGKKKLAAILRAVAGGVERAKPMIEDAVGEEKGTRARKKMTEMIELEAKSNGLLEDLDDFLKKNNINT